VYRNDVYNNVVPARVAETAVGIINTASARDIDIIGSYIIFFLKRLIFLGTVFAILIIISIGKLNFNQNI
jgi:hypothetical protein